MARAQREHAQLGFTGGLAPFSPVSAFSSSTMSASGSFDDWQRGRHVATAKQVRTAQPVQTPSLASLRRPAPRALASQAAPRCPLMTASPALMERRALSVRRG